MHAASQTLDVTGQLQLRRFKIRVVSQHKEPGVVIRCQLPVVKTQTVERTPWQTQLHIPFRDDIDITDTGPAGRSWKSRLLLSIINGSIEKYTSSSQLSHLHNDHLLKRISDTRCLFQLLLTIEKVTYTLN